MKLKTGKIERGDKVIVGFKRAKGEVRYVHHYKSQSITGDWIWDVKYLVHWYDEEYKAWRESEFHEHQIEISKSLHRENKLNKLGIK